jgi:hypothetical protein
MTIKTAACAMAVALLAGTASFAVPAAAQSAPVPAKHAKMPSSHGKKLFLSAAAEYDAGLRRGQASSARNAYLRGFRDGTSSEAYNSRAYVVNQTGDYGVPPAPGYSSYGRYGDYAPGTDGYSSYDRYGGYAPGTGGYSSYDRRTVSYGDTNGYVSDRYDSGSASVAGLMDVVTTPLTTTPYPVTRAAQLNYCAARYQSYDPASGTFLGDDGYRHYCR